MIGTLLNKVTMYRLVLYWLVFVLALGFILSFFGLVPVKAWAVLETTAVLLAATLVTNWALATLLNVTVNQESTAITALILALVLGPVTVDTEPLRFGIIALGGIVAVASKYLLVYRRHHLLNPVALGIFLTGLVFHEYASWWVGQLALLPAVVLGGLLVARKTHRLRFTGLFAGLFTALLAGWSLLQALPSDQFLQNILFVLFQSEMPFFLFAMLTEPLTSPKTFGAQAVFLTVAAIFSLPQLSLFGLDFSPELALLLANLTAFFLGPRGRYTLVLEEKRLIADGTMEFLFDKPKGLDFRPGQYLELTLNLTEKDSRGNRRYLSFASSPTEPEILVAARFPENPSAFKKQWLTMEPGDTVLASEISGDFVLPSKVSEKVALISGGIGVTPFRSMVKYLVDTQSPRDLVVIDAHSFAGHRVFEEVFQEAQAVLGATVVHTLTRADQVPEGWTGGTGPVTSGFLKASIPDIGHRTLFVSGSPAFVDSVVKSLGTLGVSRLRIKTDFFPGY